jgi:methylated-DNA-[protein]-cysteine S-methyltransferase
MSTRAHVTIDSPIGPLTLVAEGGALACLYMVDHRHAPGSSTYGEADPGAGPQAEVLELTKRQLREYFDGERQTFDIPLHSPGTPFQEKVWAALREIPYGETVSYAQLARRVDVPPGSRAVGRANGANRLAIIIPCHRVVASGGGLGGYGGGLPAKRFLLNLETRGGTRSAGVA